MENETFEIEISSTSALSKACRFTGAAAQVQFIRIPPGWNCLLNWIRNNLGSIVYANSQIRRFQKKKQKQNKTIQNANTLWRVVSKRGCIDEWFHWFRLDGRPIRVKKRSGFKNILIHVIMALLKTNTPYFLQSLYVRWPKLMQKDKDFSSASSRLNASQNNTLEAMML